MRYVEDGGRGRRIHVVQVHEPAEPDVAVRHDILFVLVPLVPDGIEEVAGQVGGQRCLTGQIVRLIFQPVPVVVGVAAAVILDLVVEVAVDGGAAVEEVQRDRFALGDGGVVAGFEDQEELRGSRSTSSS